MFTSKVDCPKWNQLVEHLKGCVVFDLQKLNQILAECRIEQSDADQYLRFSETSYARNFVYDSDEFQVIVLCWRPGQKSSVHDHGCSICGVRVLAGIANETIYRSTSAGQGREVAAQRVLHCGDVVVAPGSFVHSIENPGPDDLVTLHVYAPRLVMNAGKT